jgi:hypothetical protein
VDSTEIKDYFKKDLFYDSIVTMPLPPVYCVFIIKEKREISLENGKRNGMETNLTVNFGP